MDIRIHIIMVGAYNAYNVQKMFHFIKESLFYIHVLRVLYDDLIDSINIFARNLIFLNEISLMTFYYVPVRVSYICFHIPFLSYLSFSMYSDCINKQIKTEIYYMSVYNRSNKKPLKRGGNVLLVPMFTSTHKFDQKKSQLGRTTLNILERLMFKKQLQFVKNTTASTRYKKVNLL